MAQTLRDGGARATTTRPPGTPRSRSATCASMRGRFRDAARWFAEAELHFEHQDTFGSLIHVRAFGVGVESSPASRGAAAAVARGGCTRRSAAAQPRSSQIPYVARAEGWAARARERRRRRRAAAGGRRGAGGRVPRLRGAARLRGAPGRRAAAVGSPTSSRRSARAATPGSSPPTSRTPPRWPRATGTRCSTWPRSWRRSARCATRWRPRSRPPRRSSATAARTRPAERRRAPRSSTPPGRAREPPGIDGLDAAAIGLTRREAQVAALAGRGLSNAEIADQLVLSVRTVETHVYRAMQKRGVGDRREPLSAAT